MYNKASSWTPQYIKISRSRVRAADSDTSDGNSSLDDCLSLNYQPVHGVPRLRLKLLMIPFGLQLLYQYSAVDV